MRNGILYRILNFVFFTSAFRIAYAQQVIVGGKVGNATEVLSAATISLNNKTTLSNSKGEFAFSVKPARYILIVTYAGYKKIEKEIVLTSDSLKYYFDLVLQPSDEMENFVVLGSRSIEQRSNLSTPVPVDRIQLSKLPARQVELTRILENTIPSFTAAAHGFREGKQTVPASLRGLGPDHTLVFLNGRRLHTTASPWTFGVIGFGTVGVDLNAISSAAIESVEVLRDGASAQYGSDAIAGVIDLQLKRSTGMTSIQLHAGQYYKGDGEAFSFGINHGFLLKNNRVPADKQGFLNVTGNFRFNNYTQRNGEYDSLVYFPFPRNATAAQKDVVKMLDNEKIAERGFDRKNHRPLGDNRVFNTGFTVNGGYPVSKSTSLFWTAIGNYRFCNDISSNVYRYPFRDSLRINTLIYPDGFLPYIQSKTPDINLIGGIKGITNSRWHWDAGIIYGKNSSKIEVTNSNNASQQYTEGINAPRNFNTGKQMFSQLTNNINFTRKYSGNLKSVKSLSLAFGAEFRIENYRIKEGEEASWKNYSPGMGKEGGSQGQNGFQPANAVTKNRQVIGTYAEVEMEKTKNLLLSLAARYEYYSDFGSNLAGKLAARYKFSKWLLLRGSVSNGYRAPALQQRYYSLITTTSRNGFLFRTGTFPNESPIAKAFGISPLKAETALNFSTGFTSSISKNISIAIDGYWIQIENRIIYSGTIPDLPAVRGILDSNGFKDVQNVRFFSNAINTRTKGLDIVITGRWFIEKSTLETTLAANFNKTSLYGSIQYAKNLPDDSTYRGLLVNREERCRVEDAYPRDKIIFDLVYKAGKWRFNTNFTRYGKVAQKGSSPAINPDEIFTPKIITAMNLCYLFTPCLCLTVGAENIGDVYPDKLKYKSNTSNGLAPYNPNFAAFGCNGGYYYVNMAIHLNNKKLY